MKKINVLCAILLIICIPIITLTFSANIVVKYPAVLVYYLNDSQVMKYTDMDLTSDELANKTGSFFLGFDDNEQITEDTGYTQDPVFTDKEMEILLEIRHVVNAMLLAGIIALVVFVAVFIYLVRAKEKDLIWKYCKRGVIVAAVINAVYCVLWAIPSIRSFFYDSLTNVILDKDSNLYLIGTKGDWSTVMIVAHAIIAVVLILLICYITRKITRSRRIFTR